VYGEGINVALEATSQVPETGKSSNSELSACGLLTVTAVMAAA
jgi:hypothetical protein